jgi:hypothetical protein
MLCVIGMSVDADVKIQYKLTAALQNLPHIVVTMVYIFDITTLIATFANIVR